MFPVFLGADIGTSGVRVIAIDAQERPRAEAALPLPAPLIGAPGHVEQDPWIWWRALQGALSRLAKTLPQGAHPAALAVDGTSGTLLLADAGGRPLHRALLYSDQRAVAEAARIDRIAPAVSAARGPASALAKLMWLLDRHAGQAAHALHQADWLLGRLGAPWGLSDENNALKLGYDPVLRGWPEWLDALDIPRRLLPRVVEPGTPVGRIDPTVARALSLPADLQLVAGTTDSVAGFLATGAEAAGEGVTSLGSTLAIKLLSRRPVFVPELGIYSHRLRDRWLAGGASNTGGAVLKMFFSDAEIAALSARLDPQHLTGLDYYPLPCAGERFPVADPTLPPRLNPRPNDDARFFQAILEGIAAIEAQGYARLVEAGADALLDVRSVGGGASNTAWAQIRERMLGVPLLQARHTQAAFGTARLALQAMRDC